MDPGTNKKLQYIFCFISIMFIFLGNYVCQIPLSLPQINIMKQTQKNISEKGFDKWTHYIQQIVSVMPRIHKALVTDEIWDKKHTFINHSPLEAWFLEGLPRKLQIKKTHFPYKIQYKQMDQLNYLCIWGENTLNTPKKRHSKNINSM